VPEQRLKPVSRQRLYLSNCRKRFVSTVGESDSYRLHLAVSMHFWSVGAGPIACRSPPEGTAQSDGTTSWLDELVHRPGHPHSNRDGPQLKSIHIVAVTRMVGVCQHRGRPNPNPHQPTPPRHPEHFLIGPGVLLSRSGWASLYLVASWALKVASGPLFLRTSS
jgi:hypothetical protein